MLPSIRNGSTTRACLSKTKTISTKERVRASHSFGSHQNHFDRRYQTKAEKIAELESYLAELKLEVQAVEEHLADLRK
jgi:hypothetical protein